MMALPVAPRDVQLKPQHQTAIVEAQEALRMKLSGESSCGGHGQCHHGERREAYAPGARGFDRVGQVESHDADSIASELEL